MRVLLAAAALAAALAAPAAVAAPVTLPSSRLGLTAIPPLGFGTPPLVEQRFPGTIDARTTVDVGVAPDGTVRSVTAVQRLDLTGLGDFVFSVPAPAIDVRPVPGTRSDPGFRRRAILWQGFSPGRRTIAAEVDLRPGAAAAGLPLRVSLAGGRLVVENVTAVDALAFGGEAAQPALRGAVKAVRTAAATGAVADGLVVEATGVRPRPVRVEAPVEVQGEVGGRRFAGVLGAGRPLRLSVPARAGEPFELTARPVLADALPGRPTLERVVVALLRLARVRQYDLFLPNPDPRGRAQAVYTYRLARATAAPPPAASPPEENGWSPLAALGATGLGLAALAGLLALWARS